MNDVSTFFLNRMFLTIADDLKIFKLLNNDDDCTNLQLYNSRFERWYSMNGLFINTDKCSSISFFRNRDSLVFEKNMKSQVEKNVSTIKDMGIIFPNNLMSDNYILSVCNS